MEPTKDHRFEEAVALVREKRREGLTWKEIDLTLGYPLKWAGRVSWALAKRQRQAWEASSPEIPEPEPVVPTPSGRFCQFCGTQFSPAARFCGGCGQHAPAPVTPRPAVEAPSPVAQTERKVKAKGPLKRKR